MTLVGMHTLISRTQSANTGDWAVLVSCEHGGNRIPSEYGALFQEAAAQAALASHRGYDFGAIELAEDLAKALDALLAIATTSRLLIDLNRSPGHPQLFSEFTRALPVTQRSRIRELHYDPYRRMVSEYIAGELDSGRKLLHIAAHSFTPVLHGRRRAADASLLYDPKRVGERYLAQRWQQDLTAAAPDLQVRRNYPYLGTADGLPTFLRKLHAPSRYLGFELEFNQRWQTGEPEVWATFRKVLTTSIVTMVGLLSQQIPLE